MFKIIIAYILGILVEVNFNTDLYFLVVTFFAFGSGYLIFLFYKGHIKDIRFFIKDIGKMCLLFMVFTISSIYTESELKKVSYIHLDRSIYEIEGLVSMVKQQNNSHELIVRVGKIMDLEKDVVLKYYPEYISVYVSPYYSFELYDGVKIIGEINYKNIANYYEEKPLFFSYEYMKLSDNSFYNVSYPKHIENIPHKRNLYETIISQFHNISNSLKNKISQHMPEPYAAIAQGISLGEQENLQKDIRDIFKKSGLIHILVLSGANVVFIISIFWFFLKRLKNNRVKILGAISMSWLFIFMTGFTAPSVRAGVMSSTNILAEFFSKNITPTYSLLISLFILTLISPLNLIYSASLHLSFLACYGLFVITPTIQEKFKFSFFLATFVGIFFTITPYLLALIGTASIFGTVLTFVTEPFIMATTILSFLIIIFSFLNTYLADFFGILNTVSTKIILNIAEFGSNNLPQIYFQIGEFSLISYYVTLFLLIYLWTSTNHGQSSEAINQE